MHLTPHRDYSTPPTRVHEVLRKKQLVDGFPFVFDPDRSHDSILVDQRDGTEYLDLFSFFASLPVGHNHPGMADPKFRDRLLKAALYKPTCSDVYTQAQADFVEAFSRTLPKAFTHLFFVEGGALAVENAIKTAFDWKVRKNLQAGRGELGTQVIHFRHCFHGRSGYTVSMTNTFDPRKTQYFPKFRWPRVHNPGRLFPDTPAHRAATEAAEAQSLSEIRAAIAAHPHDIAALILETIQGEGGDVHFRPEFLRALREICNREEILLIFDEVQSGFGLTGKWWAFEHHGVEPDIFSFGKKTQVCGIAATARLDEVDSVFKIASRINSTWGGNLCDMVRCTRYIELIEQHGLLENATRVGAYALKRLETLPTLSPLVSNVRGVGLMCAFDLKTTELRDQVRKILMEQERVIILASGERTIRFRPVLDFTEAHADLAFERIARALRSLS